MPMQQPDVRAPRPGRRRGQRSQHICEVCSRTFKRTEHLTRHLRTHTKEKPFRCHCGANFTRRDLLTRHWRLTDHTPSDFTALADTDQSLVHQAPEELSIHSPCQDEPGERELSFPEVQSQGMAEEFGEGDSLTDFQSFFNFIDNVGLSAEWTPENAIFADLGDPQESPRLPTEASVPRASSPERYGTPFGGWLPSAPAGNENISIIADSNIYAERTTRGTFEITGEQSRSMGTLLEAFRAVVLDFQMPSRHALSRYLTSFFLGFHSHLLFIHRPTYKPSWHPIELTLAMCAAGAQYCFERRIAQELFRASQAITFERIRRGQPNIGPLANAFLPMVGPYSTDDVPASVVGQWSPLDTIKTLLILVGYATWGDIDLLRMSFNLRVMLIKCLRDVGLEEDHEDDSAGLSGSTTVLWNDWIQRESARRTKLVSFCYINVHSIAYNIYPELWSNELRLRLPCSTQEWQAQTAGQWSRIHRETGAKQMFLHEALNCLLDPSVHFPNDNQPNPSPLGSYILLHALIQRIQIIRELSMANSSHVRNVSSTDIHTISCALRSWTSIWQQAPESGLDPNNENGPVPFTSSALLGIAYVRLSLDIGPLRHLESRQPEVITTALTRLLPVERNGALLSALLYCTHALSIPVRLGVDRVSRSEALFWSVQHALASFECGVFLSKWLCSLDSQAEDVELKSSKNHILHWVRRIVEEAYCVVDFGPTRLKVPTDTFGLGLAVLKIWSRFFQNNSQWNFVVILGKSLEGFSQKLREDAALASRTP